MTATTSPRCWSNRTRRCLSSGRARDMIFNSCTRSSSSSSLAAANSARDVVALRIAGIVPKANLAGDLTRRGGCIARYDLHTDPRIEALTHRCGDILPHGIENRGHGRKRSPPAATARRQSVSDVSAQAMASVRMAWF